MPQNTENEPRLVNPVALNVWREVYNGRWADLRIIIGREFFITRPARGTVIRFDGRLVVRHSTRTLL
jgi:hypothetical protein